MGVGSLIVLMWMDNKNVDIFNKQLQFPIIINSIILFYKEDSHVAQAILHLLQNSVTLHNVVTLIICLLEHSLWFLQNPHAWTFSNRRFTPHFIIILRTARASRNSADVVDFDCNNDKLSSLCMYRTDDHGFSSLSIMSLSHFHWIASRAQMANLRKLLLDLRSSSYGGTWTPRHLEFIIFISDKVPWKDTNDSSRQRNWLVEEIAASMMKRWGIIFIGITPLASLPSYWRVKVKDGLALIFPNFPPFVVMHTQRSSFHSLTVFAKKDDMWFSWIVISRLILIVDLRAEYFK